MSVIRDLLVDNFLTIGLFICATIAVYIGRQSFGKTGNTYNTSRAPHGANVGRHDVKRKASTTSGRMNRIIDTGDNDFVPSEPTSRRTSIDSGVSSIGASVYNQQKLLVTVTNDKLHGNILKTYFFN